MQADPHTLTVTGCNAQETASVLRARLKEIGGHMDAPITVAFAEEPPAEPAPEHLVFSVSPHDTAAFAAEKILDDLADNNWIVLEDGALTEEEESQIRDRLQGLGYIE